MAPGDFSVIGKILYGFLFVVALPALLLFWARMTETIVALPTFRSMPTGSIIASFGATIMLYGMVAIYRYGHGLPMNAYPPSRFVTEGIFHFLSHPIYTGFSLLCIGVSIATGSPSGLWLVSPTIVLGCVALVQGFEKNATRKRFGEATTRPFIHIPSAEDLSPTPAGRISSYVIALIPWLLLCQAVRIIGTAPGVIASLPFESQLPVYEWTEPIYFSRYALILLAPLAAKSARDLREFMIFGLLSTGLAILLFIAFPFAALSRPIATQSFSGLLLTWDRAHESRAVALLSSHIVWTLLAARVFARRWPSWRSFFYGWASLVTASGIATGTHSIVDVVAGLALFPLAINIRKVWEQIRLCTERVANSWREWRFGRIRIINHGLYAGIGAFVVLSIVGTLTGPDHIPAMLVIALSIVITSAVWAQVVEGSPSLLRPYGWYGGIVGAIAGLLIAKLLGSNVWLLAGAFSVAAPWGQALGRLRCLVQGCCHGREAPTSVGIRYVHPMSRVCRLASLTNIPVHPTPLYSILYNLVIGIVMARLWQLRAALSLIIGTYLILTGLGRFVEEAYRGEPQTAIKAGLKLYQWIAIVSVFAGLFITMIGNATRVPGPGLNWESLVAAGCFGLFTWFALGVDFPHSNRRFSRLA